MCLKVKDDIKDEEEGHFLVLQDQRAREQSSLLDLGVFSSFFFLIFCGFEK